jgi:hypothetical protein
MDHDVAGRFLIPIPGSAVNNLEGTVVADLDLGTVPASTVYKRRRFHD